MCDHIAYRIEPGATWDHAVCLYCGEVIDGWPAVGAAPEPWWEVALCAAFALMAFAGLVAVLAMAVQA